jgi:hypothetical protein
MNLETIARAYTTCVELEERARHESPVFAENLTLLRSDLHSLLMTALRDSGIAFADRSQAARIAFDIVQGKQHIA